MTQWMILSLREIFSEQYLDELQVEGKILMQVPSLWCTIQTTKIAKWKQSLVNENVNIFMIVGRKIVRLFT